MQAPLRRYRWAEVLASQGRSLTWLAERTGVARVTVYSYSQGRRRPPKAWLDRTAEVLGVPASMFVDDGTVE